MPSNCHIYDHHLSSSEMSSNLFYRQTQKKPSPPPLCRVAQVSMFLSSTDNRLRNCRELLDAFFLQRILHHLTIHYKSFFSTSIQCAQRENFYLWLRARAHPEKFVSLMGSMACKRRFVQMVVKIKRMTDFSIAGSLAFASLMKESAKRQQTFHFHLVIYGFCSQENA